MIASLCYVYHYTPEQVRAMSLVDVDALTAYAQKVADAGRR